MADPSVVSDDKCDISQNSRILHDMDNSISESLAQEFDTSMHDDYADFSDQTFLKTINLGTPAEDSQQLAAVPAGVHTLSPEVDNNGDLQCGQPFNDDFKVASVVFDRLDSELCGLTQDLYISTLLSLCHDNDDTLACYRSELAIRVQRCANPPHGVLKDRRNSTRCTLNEKFAQDCYTMEQFLQGNSSNIDHIFKKANFVNATQSSFFTPQRQTNNMTDIIHEVKLLKNTVASLQTEVHLLKVQSDTNKTEIKSFSTNLKEKIREMKQELDASADIFSAEKN